MRRNKQAPRWPFVVSGLFFVSLLAATVAGKLPLPLLALYAASSIAAFGTYAWDKSAARDRRWRVRESSLHLLALIGGWPGALLAQQQLRHKSAKPAFLTVFWTTALLNCSALVLYFTPAGKHALRAALGFN